MIANALKKSPWWCLLSLVAVGWTPAETLHAQSSMVPDAARKAVARRQELVAKADDAALRGQRFMADKDFDAAVTEFRKALDLLPDAPVVQERRNEYTRQFADASVALARQRAEEGRYDESIKLVTAVLDPGIDPENREARQLLEDLNDPEIYSPAVTPEHIARVKRVETALKVAESYIRLGDYDSAEQKYFEALNFDPYNSASRRGLEDVERQRRLYYDSAYDQTRATFLRQVSELWELEVPRFGLTGGEIIEPTAEITGVDYINEKLKRIYIPEIEFEDTPLSDAIDFLRAKSVELDDLEPDPSRKGINIIIRTGGSGGGGGGLGGGGADLGFDDPAGGGGGGFGGGDDPSQTRISLKLSNVPLVEALRYTTELARLKFKVESNAVVIIPITEVSDDLFTQVFRVPPGFLKAGGDGGGGGVSDDPFADLGGGGGGGTTLAARPTARAVLEEAGITFPPGSSAIYNPTTSQLVVRNSQTNLDLVESFVDAQKEDVQKQIYITSKFVEVRQDDNETFGFDWLLGQFNVGSSDKVFASGGTIGNARNELNNLDFPFIAPGAATALGDFPLTSANRTGDLAVNTSTIDNLLTTAQAGQTVLAPGIMSLAGVFTDPQFQVVLRAISQHKGSDLLSAPSVVARSGQRAKIEVIREFIYPSEYDPPEIPDTFGTGITGTTGLTGGSEVSSFPVTPANPAAFETRNVGVTLEVDPVIGADGFTIDLNLNPEVVEFEGFINYGSPIFSGGVANGQPVQIQLTENRIEMPVFATRRVTTAVTIWDGQTVAVGGLIREDIQHVEDKLPILGDVPVVGFLFRTEAEVHNKRNLTVFVTARLIDPAGIPINQDLSGPADPVDL